MLGSNENVDEGGERMKGRKEWRMTREASEIQIFK